MYQKTIVEMVLEMRYVRRPRHIVNSIMFCLDVEHEPVITANSLLKNGGISSQMKYSLTFTKRKLKNILVTLDWFNKGNIYGIEAVFHNCGGNKGVILFNMFPDKMSLLSRIQAGFAYLSGRRAYKFLLEQDKANWDEFRLYTDLRGIPRGSFQFYECGFSDMLLNNRHGVNQLIRLFTKTEGWFSKTWIMPTDVLNMYHDKKKKKRLDSRQQIW